MAFSLDLAKEVEQAVLCWCYELNVSADCGLFLNAGLGIRTLLGRGRGRELLLASLFEVFLLRKAAWLLISWLQSFCRVLRVVALINFRMLVTSEAWWSYSCIIV